MAMYTGITLKTKPYFFLAFNSSEFYEHKSCAKLTILGLLLAIESIYCCWYYAVCCMQWITTRTGDLEAVGLKYQSTFFLQLF